MNNGSSTNRFESDLVEDSEGAIMNFIFKIFLKFAKTKYVEWVDIRLWTRALEKSTMSHAKR
jgi:hypothetical protein